MDKKKGSNRSQIVFGDKNDLKSLDSHLRFLMKTGYIKNCIFDGKKGFIVEVNEDEKKLINLYKKEISK